MKSHSDYLLSVTTQNIWSRNTCCDFTGQTIDIAKGRKYWRSKDLGQLLYFTFKTFHSYEVYFFFFTLFHLSGFAFHYQRIPNQVNKNYSFFSVIS